MAAKGAHITQNVVTKPSIFEAVAADSLDATFYPALKRVVTFLATIKPNAFGYLLKYYDETFLLFNTVVQGYYLRHRGGSLSEVFYGLTRVTGAGLEPERIKKRLSLFFLVAGPYLYHKVNQRLQQWKDEYENGRPVSPEKIRMAEYFPIVKACYESVRLVMCLRYLAGLGSSHSPILRGLNLTLTYLTEEDDSWSFRDFFAGKVQLTTMMSAVLLRGLELSAFFLQFIEWWQNETTMGDLSKLPVPEAPDLDVNCNRYLNKCALCLQELQIPTAVSTSGYVFCYCCITAHLQKESRCPVTRYPATVSDLIRIYDGDE
ncbi:peroxisome assembly protein 12 [Uranotaenia lowii]|uniref:peroxisome assembly protein 12 n=1 Tax=Uranotaenia lowii TaxID=190385 RepID=UPI00247AB079|nr:peroxisome assembly protein 12 [Uranotaenia lowii]